MRGRRLIWVGCVFLSLTLCTSSNWDLIMLRKTRTLRQEKQQRQQSTGDLLVDIKWTKTYSERNACFPMLHWLVFSPLSLWLDQLTAMLAVRNYWAKQLCWMREEDRCNWCANNSYKCQCLSIDWYCVCVQQWLTLVCSQFSIFRIRNSQLAKLYPNQFIHLRLHLVDAGVAATLAFAQRKHSDELRNIYDSFHMSANRCALVP